MNKNNYKEQWLNCEDSLGMAHFLAENKILTHHEIVKIGVAFVEMIGFEKDLDERIPNALVFAKKYLDNPIYENADHQAIYSAASASVRAINLATFARLKNVYTLEATKLAYSISCAQSAAGAAGLTTNNENINNTFYNICVNSATSMGRAYLISKNNSNTTENFTYGYEKAFQKQATYLKQFISITEIEKRLSSTETTNTI